MFCESCLYKLYKCGDHGTRIMGYAGMFVLVSLADLELLQPGYQVG